MESGIIFNQVVKEVLTDKIFLSKTLKEVKCWVLEKEYSTAKSIQHRGPEVGPCLLLFRNPEGAAGAGGGQGQKRLARSPEG